tara:strand:- start:3709 stop:4587 length:879 start_codon:yes stop_codon:yes gene_type:complete
MINERKIVLIAFATNDLKRSAKRLKYQALKSKYYTDIKIFSSNDLDEHTKSFIDDIIKKNGKRGFGYWYWKPCLILKILKELKDNDIVHYLDIGCHININNEKFKSYISLLDSNFKGLMAFQYYPLKNNDDITNINFPKREEYKFTKADLLNYFGYLDNDEIIKSPQYWAGSFFIKKNDFCINFLESWIDIFKNNFNLVNDSPSIKKNYPGFIENRHDQSIFSLLCKKNSIYSISAYESDWAIKNNQRTWEHNQSNPFLAKRDLEYNILKRFLNRQKRNLNRLKYKLKNRFR